MRSWQNFLSDFEISIFALASGQIFLTMVKRTSLISEFQKIAFAPFDYFATMNVHFKTLLCDFFLYELTIYFHIEKLSCVGM